MNNNTISTKYQQVNSKLIVSDPSYQRILDFNRVKNIVSHFNPLLANPIKVSYRDDKYYVFDGQHTLAALKMKNGNQDLAVNCKVYSGLTQADEAKLFSEQNGIAKTVESGAKMKALYVAGDIEIIELTNAIRGLGIRFDFSKSKAPNKIIAYAAIYKIYKKTSASEFKDILTIIRDSWGGEADSYNKEILNGMFLFYTNHKAVIRKDICIDHFSMVSPLAIIREAKVWKDGGDARYERQLITAYNKRLRVGKIEI